MHLNGRILYFIPNIESNIYDLELMSEAINTFTPLNLLTNLNSNEKNVSLPYKPN